VTDGGADVSNTLTSDEITTAAPAVFSRVDSNGTGYLTRAGGFSGSTANKLLTFAIKGKMLSGDGVNQAIINQHTTSVKPVSVARRSTNTIRISARDSGGTEILRVDSAVNAIVVATGDFIVIGSYNLGTGAAHMYVNDVSSRSGTDTLSDFAINWTSTQTLGMVAGPDGAGPCDMEIDYIYLTNEYLDLSVAGNRTPFSTPAGMGTDGSLPTGTQPLLFLRGNAAAWNGGTANQGSGGAFTAASATFTDI